MQSTPEEAAGPSNGTDETGGGGGGKGESRCMGSSPWPRRKESEDSKEQKDFLVRSGELPHSTHLTCLVHFLFDMQYLDHDVCTFLDPLPVMCCQFALCRGRHPRPTRHFLDDDDRGTAHSCIVELVPFHMLSHATYSLSYVGPHCHACMHPLPMVCFQYALCCVRWFGPSRHFFCDDGREETRSCVVEVHSCHSSWPTVADLFCTMALVMFLMFLTVVLSCIAIRAKRHRYVPVSLLSFFSNSTCNPFRSRPHTHSSTKHTTSQTTNTRCPNNYTQTLDGHGLTTSSTQSQKILHNTPPTITSTRTYTSEITRDVLALLLTLDAIHEARPTSFTKHSIIHRCLISSGAIPSGYRGSRAMTNVSIFNLNQLL